MRFALAGVVLWGVSAGVSTSAATPAASDRCLTDPAGSADALSAGAQASLVVYAPEERRSVASGHKLVLVRGQVPAPGGDVLAKVVEAGYRSIAERFPAASFPDRVTVSLGDLPGDGSGPGAGLLKAGRDSRSAEIVLSRNLSGRSLERALAHQLGHLVGASAPASIWAGPPGQGWRVWDEATASWLADRIVPEDDADPARFDGSVSGRSPLADPAAARAWVRYLSARLSEAVIAEVWDEGRASPETGLADATRRVLAAHGTTLEDEAAGFGVWLLVESRRESVRSRIAAPLVLAAEAVRFPAGGEAAEGPEAYATSYLRLESGWSPGGLRIEIDADPGARWLASALVVPSGEFLPSSRVAFPAAHGGRTALTVPVADAAEVIVAVTQVGDAAGRLGWSFLVEPDDRFPYVLERLDAEPTADGVRIVWETASEADVEGWSVFRTSWPGEGLQAVNGVLVPGSSRLDASGGGAYSLIDVAVDPGRTYYYCVQALTGDGLPASSHFVSVTPAR